MCVEWRIFAERVAALLALQSDRAFRIAAPDGPDDCMARGETSPILASCSPA